MHNHIISGMSAAICLRQSVQLPLSRLAVMEDNFALGPLIAENSAFSDARTAFWAQAMPDDGDACSQFMEHSLREFHGQLAASTHVTLWLSPGVHDQLMFAWLVQQLATYDIGWHQVQVKHLYNDARAARSYGSLSELWPEEFSMCRDLVMQDAHIDYAQRAYAALVSSAPDALIALCEDKSEVALPEMQLALRAYVRRYPEKASGLDVIERALLEQCRIGRQVTDHIIAGVMNSGRLANGRLHIDHAYLFRRLIELSQLHASSPLVTLHGAHGEEMSMSHTEIEVTTLGLSVLEGAQNHMALNQMEHHIGGVHLGASNDVQWRYHCDTLVTI